MYASVCMYVYNVCICACMYKSAFMRMYVFMQRMYICMYVCIYVYLCMSVCYVYMYVIMYIYNVCASIKCVSSLFVYPSVHLSACPPAPIYVYLYAHLSLFVYYLSVCLSDWCTYVCMPCHIMWYNVWMVVIAQKLFSKTLEDYISSTADYKNQKLICLMSQKPFSLFSVISE